MLMIMVLRLTTGTDSFGLNHKPNESIHIRDCICCDRTHVHLVAVLLVHAISFIRKRMHINENTDCVPVNDV